MQADASARRMHLAYLWIHALATPFWIIYNLMPYILYKDLHATPFQITTLVILKPLVSLFSVYWGEAIKQRRDLLLSNVIWARFLSLAPFFFFPFVDNVWFFIGASVLYMTLHRGVVPAWMEILKLNLPLERMGKTFAAGSLIGYFGNTLSPFLIGWLLDDYFQAWRWLFPLTAFISLATIFISARIPIPKSACVPAKEETEQLSPNQLTHTASKSHGSRSSLLERLLAPWKSAIEILKSNVNFRKFQWGFMLGGAGTMIAQPILPQFCVDILDLNYKEMTIAFACCKGIGFVLTTPLWARYLNKTNIFRFASWPPFWVFCYSICLFSAQMHLAWLFAAYLCYGIMEGGSSLAWNLSGPIFSKDADSSSFSNINVLSVGLRGCVVPAMGSLLGTLLGAPVVIVIGGALCLLANLTFIRYSQQTKVKQAEAA